MLELSKQDVAVCKLLSLCEGIAQSGLLGEKTEQLLRERIVEASNAFGIPTIAERNATQQRENA